MPQDLAILLPNPQNDATAEPRAVRTLVRRSMHVS